MKSSRKHDYHYSFKNLRSIKTMSKSNSNSKKQNGHEVVKALDDFISGTVKTPYDEESKTLYFDPFNIPDGALEKTRPATPGDFLTNSIVKDISLGEDRAVDGTVIKLVQDNHDVVLTVEGDKIRIKNGVDESVVEDKIGLIKLLNMAS